LRYQKKIVPTSEAVNIQLIHKGLFHQSSFYIRNVLFICLSAFQTTVAIYFQLTYLSFTSLTAVIRLLYDK